ncbi:MAG: Two-component system response regulator, partial [Gemmatimonadetes bacterium]|nr:Two-component system response regulator [Gemmatimonadota bacterium]
VPIAVPTITMGREADNTLSIPEAAVSRHHARFERRDDGHTWVVDAPSMNGTFVNGRRVIEQSLVAHDVLRIGDTLFRYVDKGIYGYGAYRIDGGVVRQARPFKHDVEQPFLIGGYQIDAVLDMIVKVAKTPISVVVTGESGTGKELVAREIHRRSRRADQVMVAVDLGAVAESLFESELFGHLKGAFTDARADRVGAFELADGGTLFMDEIGTMPHEQQAKLLRVLQTGELQRVGQSRTRKVDVRVLSATNTDIPRAAEEGRFREDLLFRLNTVEIHLPPLRERREDVAPLAMLFLDRTATQYRKHLTGFDPEAMKAMLAYPWPGNIRELEHTVERAVLLAQGTTIAAEDLALRGRVPAAVSMEEMSLEDAEQLLIRKALARFDGNVSRAAEALGLSRSALYRRLERYGL